MREQGHKRGTAYLLVLIAVLVTVAIGVTGAMVHKSRREHLIRASEIEHARQIAQAGLELAVAYIQADDSWRTLRGLGVWMDEEPLLGGLLTVTAHDSDGNATDDYDDQVTLIAEGTFGRARQSVSATFTPVRVALSSLSYGASAVDDLGFNGTLNADVPVAANSSSSALLSSVRTPVYAGESITGLTYTRGTFANSGTREHPDAATVLAWYTANGTTINFASLPSGRIENVVLGPNQNPFGSPNAMGIYVINCGGASIRIRNCRIEGTIVLLNAGTSSAVEQSVNWKPASPTMPAILTQGRIAIDLTSTFLSESSQNVNFNPATAPYNGVSDSDKSDTYPSRVHGLVYATDDVTLRGTSSISGPILAGDDLGISGTITLTFEPAYAENPPKGFIKRYNMLLDTGTLARVVDD